MKKSHIIAIQVVLLATGACATKQLSKSMLEEGKLRPEPNVLHLKRSPFGRTLALAMRGPVDIYWHRGAPHEHEQECLKDHEHGPDCKPNHSEHGPGFENGHDHSDGGHHHHDEPGATDVLTDEVKRLTGSDPGAAEEPASGTEAAAEDSGLRSSLLERIRSMRQAYYSRTNTRADTRMHKAFIMGETQKRLRISYEMDPSNIACYGAYFLFLSEALARVEGEEAEDGVIRQRLDAALKLAHLTVAYCVQHNDEAPAMVTAATACHDFLQIYFTRPDPNLQLAGEFLQTLDSCLMRYEKLRREMKADGRWDRYPIYRANEMENAYSLVRIMRDFDHEMFSRHTGSPAASAAEEGS